MSGNKTSPAKPSGGNVNLNLKVSKRVLAAPTPTSIGNCSRSPYNASGIPNVSYANFKFKPLEPYSDLTYDRYCGPTPESNWILPGVMLVGAYPASNDDNETFDLISSILLLGISKFVCLQKEYREAGVTEMMWRNGKCIRPYFLDVKLIVDNQHSIELFRQPYLDATGTGTGTGTGGVVTGSNLSRTASVAVPVQRNSRANLPNNVHNCFKRVVSAEQLGFIHLPIEDCNVTDDTGVLLLARQLVHDISRGDVLYLHCWGGHGRTGTVVCLMMHLMYGLTAIEAMKRCQHVHDLRQYPVKVGSPQTETQRQQVVRIIAMLEAQRRAELENEKMQAQMRAHAHAESQMQTQAEVQKTQGNACTTEDILEETSELTECGGIGKNDNGGGMGTPRQSPTHGMDSSLDRGSPEVMRMEVDLNLQSQLHPTSPVPIINPSSIPIPTSGNPSNLSGRVRARGASDNGNALANQQTAPTSSTGVGAAVGTLKADQVREPSTVTSNRTSVSVSVPGVETSVNPTPSKIPVRTGAAIPGYAPAAPNSSTPSSTAALTNATANTGSEADSLQKGGLHRFRQQWRTPTGTAEASRNSNSASDAPTSPLPSSVACTVPSTPTPTPTVTNTNTTAAGAAAGGGSGSGTGGLSKIFNNYIGLNDPLPENQEQSQEKDSVGSALPFTGEGGHARVTGTGTAGTGTGTGAAGTGTGTAGTGTVVIETEAVSHNPSAVAELTGLAFPSPIITDPPTNAIDGNNGSQVSSPVMAQKAKFARTTPTPTKEAQKDFIAQSNDLGLTSGPCL